MCLFSHLAMYVFLTKETRMQRYAKMTALVVVVALAAAAFAAQNRAPTPSVYLLGEGEMSGIVGDACTSPCVRTDYNCRTLFTKSYMGSTVCYYCDSMSTRLKCCEIGRDGSTCNEEAGRSARIPTFITQLRIRRWDKAVEAAAPRLALPMTEANVTS